MALTAKQYNKLRKGQRILFVGFDSVQEYKVIKQRSAVNFTFEPVFQFIKIVLGDKYFPSSYRKNDLSYNSSLENFFFRRDLKKAKERLIENLESEKGDRELDIEHINEVLEKLVGK